MNLFSELRNHLIGVIQGLVEKGNLPGGLDLAPVTVEPPRDPAHGDFATNAAMVLAKPAKMAPRAIADLIVAGLAAHPDVTGAEVAGPGFINIRVRPSLWLKQVGAILGEGIAYGASSMGAGQKVNVEYVSANPTGPLHVGHCRGAVFGDALAALLEKAGFAVCREYYINDAGAQVDVLARSAHLRYREALGDQIGEIPAGLYPGDYLKPVGEALVAQFGNRFRSAPEGEWLAEFRKATIAAMMIAIREDLAALNIKQEVFSSERTLHDDGRVQLAFDQLVAKGLIYEGVLEPPKGKKPDDWEPRPQTLFRATQFGDDVDRPLKKSDGSWTYFAADIAYHFDKVKRGFNDLIDVWGADHGGYIKRVQAAVKALTGGSAALDVKICQLVNLLDGGQPVKMSKRAGSFVTLRDVVDQVGRDVVRFIMLTRKNDAALDFDFKKVTEQSKDNPVFYVQYAHARCHSLYRRAAEEAGISLPEIGQAVAGRLPERLQREAELAMVRLLAQWPRMVEAAAHAHEPHRIAFYLYDVASAFHGLWSLGNDDATQRFVLADDRELTLDRLALVRAVQTVIASGLGVMGVTPMDELRA